MAQPLKHRQSDSARVKPVHLLGHHGLGHFPTRSLWLTGLFTMLIMGSPHYHTVRTLAVAAATVPCAQPTVSKHFTSAMATVAVLHQGAPGQMTWLEDPPPSLRPTYCFASVTVWTENKNVTISDRFICFILKVKQSAVLAACVLRATTKKVLNFLEEKSAPQEKILAMPMPLGAQLLWPPM